MYPAYDDEYRAPAELRADVTAGSLRQEDAGELGAEKAREHSLASLECDCVADPCEGKRNDGGARRPGREPRDRQLAEGSRERGGCRCDAGDQRKDCRNAVFAEAVADRAEGELEEPIADREGGHDDGGGADRGRESMRDLRQQRITDADVERARECCEREQRNGPQRRLRRHFRWGRAHDRGGAFAAPSFTAATPISTAERPIAIDAVNGSPSTKQPMTTPNAALRKLTVEVPSDPSVRISRK